MDIFRRKLQSHNELVGMSQAQALSIVKSFGKHLEHASPLIKDTSLLPHTKNQIMTALNIWEEVCQARLSSQSLSEQERTEATTLLESVKASRMLLCQYADIDETDRSIVGNINRYRTLREIPANKQEEFFTLENKYSLRGMESGIPGFGALGNSIANKKE